MEINMKCPLCSLIDVKDVLYKRALKCPVCDNGRFITEEEFRHMQTSQCKKNSLFKGSPYDIAIVYVSKQRRYDLKDSGLFNEYNMMRTVPLGSEYLGDTQVPVISTSILNEFPFLTMTSSLVNSVCQEEQGIFWVYTKRLVKSETTFVEEEHIGYYSSSIGRPVVVDFSRGSRIIFGGNHYRDYKVEVSRIVDNKAYFTVDDRKCNIMWLDTRIIYQLGYTPNGIFCVRLGLKEDSMFKDLFSSFSMSFLEDVNPLSVAARVRDLDCYPKITSDITIDPKYINPVQKTAATVIDDDDDYYNDDSLWPVSHTHHTSWKREPEKAYMYASDGIIIEEYEENNQTLEETLEELSF